MRAPLKTALASWAPSINIIIIIIIIIIINSFIGKIWQSSEWLQHVEQETSASAGSESEGYWNKDSGYYVYDYVNC